MMKSKRTLVSLRLWAAMSLLAMLAGCGYKTPPVAPQSMVPRPVADLRHELNETGVTLYWTYPSKTVTGKDLDEIDSFFLYRAVVPADDYCDTCPVPFGAPISLPGGVLPGKGDRTGSYVETLLRPNNVYFFKIRSKSGWMAESEDSNLVSFLWENPPANPSGLSAEAADGKVALRWQKVATHLDGTPLDKPVKYQVSRSVDGGPFENIGGMLPSESYVDDQAGSGHKHAYRVQAFAVHGKGTVGGGFSQTVEAGATDKTAPQPPVNVKTARTASSVKIYWDRGTEKDLAGYRVYRRIGDAAEPELIGEVKEPYNLYEDLKAPEKGAKALYSVTSFDKSSPPNESQRSTEAALR